MKSKGKIIVASAITILSLANFGFSDGHESDTYGPYPVTLKGYSGSKTNSVSYTGQIGRQVLHTTIKKLSSQGNGGGNAGRIKAEMMAYFGGTDKNKKILSPVDKGDFNIKQETMDEISKTNLAGNYRKDDVLAPEFIRTFLTTRFVGNLFLQWHSTLVHVSPFGLPF